jgi:hypothetical protein
VFDWAAFADIEVGKAIFIWNIDVVADVWFALDVLVSLSGHESMRLVMMAQALCH